MTLAAVNLPASVISPRPPALRSIQCLAVNHASCRLLVAPDAGLLPAAQAVELAMAVRPSGCTAGSSPGGRSRPVARVLDIVAQSPFRISARKCLSCPRLGQLVSCALVTTRVTQVLIPDHAVCVRSVANNVFRTPEPAGSRRIDRADARVASARQCPDRGVAVYRAPRSADLPTAEPGLQDLPARPSEAIMPNY